MTIQPPPEGTPNDPNPNEAIPADSALRASDSDRDRAASVLQAATADGRVSASELEERLQLVYSAKSKSELASVVQDLQPAQLANATPTATKDVGALSGFVRDGRWVVGGKYRATAFISTGVIDLREAEFTSPETTIRVGSWLGTVYVVVPKDAEVRVSGTGVIGGFKQDRETEGHAATRRINVTGVAVIGTVYVVHELPAARERRIQKRKQKSIGGR